MRNSSLSSTIRIRRCSKYEKEKLYYTLSKLNTLSPLKVLERGYAIVLKEDNVVLTVNELKTGDKIKIKMKDGSKNAIIE